MAGDTPIDVRLYRPGAILVLDLVKHSGKERLAVHDVQKAMEDVLCRTKDLLKITDAHFNYTGDGYVCAFVGDASAKIIDFINAALPELMRRFGRHSQQLRAGIDFGLVHLTKNALTGKYEYFDLPSIQAARLEQSAQPDQILCTETVQRLFKHHYPENFSKVSLRVYTKDREITAFEFVVSDADHVRQYLSDFFFGPKTSIRQGQGLRKKIMFVDDEEAIREVLPTMFSAEWPEYELLTYSNGLDAFNAFEMDKFAIAFVDMVMPRMDGFELTRRLSVLDPELSVVAVTALHDRDLTKQFFESGGSYLLLKPFHKDQFRAAVRTALFGNSSKAIRNSLGALCDDQGSLMVSLHELHDQFQIILLQVKDQEDSASGLLRHKARQIINDLVNRARAGSDILATLSVAKAQLSCVERLSGVVGRSGLSELQPYLEGLMADLHTLNPNIEFALSCAIGKESRGAVPHTRILVLAISELIDNAIEALKGSGKIETKISVLRSAGVIQVRVEDSGPGLPSSLLQTAFDEGISTKGQGRGLGLSLIRDAVGALRGRINYEYSGGAVFTVLVPLQG